MKAAGSHEKDKRKKEDAGDLGSPIFLDSYVRMS